MGTSTKQKAYRMRLIKTFLVLTMLIVTSANSNAQTTAVIDSTSIDTLQQLKFNYKSLIIPAVLMTYGVVGLENNDLKLLNLEIKEEVNENIDKKITIDDFSQYAPAATVYILNNIGVKGKNNLRDRSIILGTSYAMVLGSVYGLKNWTKIERPDKSGNSSFPSGHTATAFAGAEFLWQEYKDVSVWYGISGYIVAAGTGVFRIYNDKHWFTDVVMGAGIGILSTKAAYWMYPYLNKHVFSGKQNKSTTMLAPFYNGKEAGIGLVINGF